MRIFLLFISLFYCSANGQNLDDGLLSYWPLDGNGDDISGNSYNGTVYKTTTITDRNGNINSALSFDQNSYINLGNVLNIGYEDFSFSAWFRVDPLNTELGMYTILSKAHYGPAPQYAIGIHNNKLRTRFIYNSGIDIIGNKLINDNRWHSFIVTIKRNENIKLYLDGVLDTSVSITDSPEFNVVNNFNLSIGQYEYKKYRFQGDLDEIRIYNRVISREEIASLSESEVEGETGCINLITGINGNVSIGGDKADGYGLSVGGSIYTDEVKVMDVDTWPDYVFSSGYDLMNLQRLESYIKSYGHLPAVPSSEEVFSNGISLAEMDKVNLKKLEELSLYLIDQHNRLKELDAVKESVTVSWKPRANLSAWVERSGIVSSLPTIDSLSLGLSCQGDNVGINTSDTGGYRLGVTGGILSEGVKVESVSNWPDYVFSADYSLRSFDELEAYIEANRHLPGLPSAKAIESEGYSLSEMDRLLMEKVEEFTLYIIDQERHLTELSKELGVDFPTKSHKWPGTSENLLAENSESHYKDYTKNEVQNAPDQILAEVSGTMTSPLCDAISCNGEEVGIGTDPVEGYRLAVAGGILTDDIQVASVSNWPDYVFEADYKLSELSGLSAYIEKEGHLPGVPKAEVVEQEGYRLEAMDALLLEKIEELTLYLIGQERQITFLKGQGRGK